MKVWHASPSSNRNSIARNGLLANPKKKLYSEAHGLYLWKNKAKAAWFASVECRDNRVPYDLYEVEAFESALRSDEMLQMPDAVYSIVNIPPSRIRRIDTIECTQLKESEEPISEPRKVLKAYKLFRTKKSHPGKLFPLFIGTDQPTPIGRWIPARFIPTKGFAERPGWHVGSAPMATHLMRKDGTMPPDRVWALVEIPADKDWQQEADRQKTKDIKGAVPEGGFYRFPRPFRQGGEWLISGAMKVLKVLDDDEVQSIIKSGVSHRPESNPNYSGQIDESMNIQDLQQQATKTVNHIASTVHRGKKVELLGPVVVNAGKMIFHDDEALTPGEAEWKRVKEGWKGLLFGVGKARYFVAEKDPNRAWFLVPYGTEPDAFQPKKTDQRATLRTIYNAHGAHPDFTADMETPLPILYIPRESVTFLRGSHQGGEWLKPSTSLRDVIVLDGRTVILGHEQAGAAIRGKKAIRAIDIGHLRNLDEAKGGMKAPPIVKSKAFESWFRGSMVISPKGKPLVVYHGSPKPGFTRFSQAKGNTTNQLRHLGFWFTSDPGSAAQFTKEIEHGAFGSWQSKEYQGGVYPVFLSIKNPKIYQPMDAAEKDATLTEMESQLAELKKELPFFYHDMPHERRALHNQISDKINVLRQRMMFIKNDDPIEQLMDDRDEFAKWINGDEGVRGAWRKRYVETGDIRETTEKLKQKLITQGYDGIILRSSKYDMPRKGTQADQFVAFYPSQIKSAIAAKYFDPESEEITDSFILTAALLQISQIR